MKKLLGLLFVFLLFNGTAYACCGNGVYVGDYVITDQASLDANNQRFY